MKKDATNKSTKESTAVKFGKEFHELWDTLDDEMDKHELKHFVDDENQPKMKELNNSGDEIGINEVLLIGSYLAMNHLHQLYHDGEIEHMKSNIEAMFEGKVELRQIAPENIPEDLLKALEGIVDLGRDLKNKKKPRGKK